MSYKILPRVPHLGGPALGWVHVLECVGKLPVFMLSGSPAAGCVANLYYIPLTEHLFLFFSILFLFLLLYLCVCIHF